MRQVVYSCAMSLDGYIAGPNGEYDWIVMDPDVDFAALAARFDTYLMGRNTFEAVRAMGGGSQAGVRTFVFSRTLEAGEREGVTVSSDAEGVVRGLRVEPGKDIWLFGGGELCASLLGAGLVDSVEVAVVPVLLGGGIPLLPAPVARTSLVLRRHRVYAKSGMVAIEYDVQR